MEVVLTRKEEDVYVDTEVNCDYCDADDLHNKHGYFLHCSSCEHDICPKCSMRLESANTRHERPIASSQAETDSAVSTCEGSQAGVDPAEKADLVKLAETEPVESTDPVKQGGPELVESTDHGQRPETDLTELTDHHEQEACPAESTDHRQQEEPVPAVQDICPTKFHQDNEVLTTTPTQYATQDAFMERSALMKFCRICTFGAR